MSENSDLLNVGNDLYLKAIFPSHIGTAVCPFHNEIQQDYLKVLGTKVEGYRYTGHHKDKRFKRLNNWIDEKVEKYAEVHLVEKGTIKAKQSWTVNYRPEEYQPSHVHNARITCVYFLKSDINDSPLTFERSEGLLDDIRDKTPEELRHKSNDFTFIEYYFPPEEGRLYIWKGRTLRHKVDPKNGDLSPRIVMTYNYD